IEAAAYPHLTQLRSMLSGKWYSDRNQVLPISYTPDSLTDGEKERFHLYVSGAGGTGKSCFLRALYERLNHNSNVLPVWYRVDDPGSEWDTVCRRLMEIAGEAVVGTQELAGDKERLLPQKENLGPFLRELAARLREHSHPRSEIVVFIDQLERTFES